MPLASVVNAPPLTREPGQVYVCPPNVVVVPTVREPARVKSPVGVRTLFPLKKFKFPVWLSPNVKVALFLVAMVAAFENVKLPETVAEPLTSNFAPGVVVPIPTLPEVPPTERVAELAKISNLFVPVEFNEGLVPESVKVVPANVKLPEEVRTLLLL